MNQKRSQAVAKPIAKTTTPVRTSTKSAKQSRSRLVPVAAVLAAAAVVLVVRAATRRPAEPDRLFLNDEVVLTKPPPVPDSDLRFLQVQFHRLAAYRISAEQHPNDANEQIEYGNAAIQVGDPLEAIAPLKSAVRLTHTPSADLYFNLGRAQDMVGLYGDALATYQQMIRAYPRDGRGYLQECLTYQLLNRPPEEIQSLESELAALPATDVLGRIPLARQFDVDGDTGRALQEAQAIRNQNPTSSQAILAVVDLLISSERIPEARPLVSDLLAREPTNHHAHYEMGVILASPSLPDHDAAAAEHELLTAAREAPGNKEYYRRLGELYLDQGRWRQCAYIALQLLSVSPGASVGRQYLAQSLAHLGDKAGAAEQGAIAARLITRDSEADGIKDRLFTHASSAEANLELALHCEKYGQFSNALVRVQQACVLASSSREARAALEDLCARIGTSPPTIPLPESKRL